MNCRKTLYGLTAIGLLVGLLSLRVSGQQGNGSMIYALLHDGLSTAALQSTANSSLSTIATNTSTTAANVNTINSTLGSPFQAGGSISNTAFAANAGTNLNTSGLATQTTTASILSALGSPLQAGGTVVTNANASTASYSLTGSQSTNALLASLTPTTTQATVGWNSFQIQVTVAGTGITTVVVQESLDGTHWETSVRGYENHNATIQATSFGTGTIYVIPPAPYVQVLLNGTQSGSTTTVCLTGLTNAFGAALSTFSGGQTVGIVNINPTTSGGWSKANLYSLTNVAQSIKASAGQIGILVLGNPNSSGEWVETYNILSTTVTVGTSAIAATFYVPANSTVTVPLFPGDAYSAAISASATTTATGSTAPTTSLSVVVYYD